VHNAITIARQDAQVTRVTLPMERGGATGTVRVADDGPGLRKAVRTDFDLC
jgi:hypothetical protein